MKYNYRQDYTHIFDTPAKMEQESAIVSKIMQLLNDNKYDNIYDFITKNPTYQDFLKKHKIFSHVYTLVIVWVGWALFAFDDMGRVIQYLKAMFGLSGAGFANRETLYLLLSYAVMLVILILASTPYPRQWAMKVMNLLEGKKKADNEAAEKKEIAFGSVVSTVLQLAFVAVVFVISTAYLVDATYNPFLYFRF